MVSGPPSFFRLLGTDVVNSAIVVLIAGHAVFKGFGMAVKESKIAAPSVTRLRPDPNQIGAGVAGRAEIGGAVCAQDLNVWEGGRLVPRPTDPKIYLRRPELPKIPDLMGWNIYPGWYFGAPDDAGPILDQLRYTSRSGGICMSEYGAGANPLHHEENCQQQTNTVSQWHPEEWQSIDHEHDWAAIKARPFVWGSFVWNMFDFVVAGRNEVGVPCRNDKGLVTNDRQLKKDAFYFYQANWSDTPVLYITSRRFVQRTNAVTEVKIYSNAKRVELFVNGKSLGVTKPDELHIARWTKVNLATGKNFIKAIAYADGRLIEDHCGWNLIQNR